MKRAEHSVNTGLRLDSATLPRVAGVDLASTSARIAAWGGSPRVYAWSLTQGELTPANVRGVATIAGWRAGVVGLRDAALELIPTLDGSAAVLGLAESDLAAFISGQETDPFAWPGPQQLVATVGRFSGLGGPWVEPPTGATAVAPGEFRVSTGTAQWRLLADIFGARVSPADGLTVPAALSPQPAVAAVTAVNSYLVRLERT